MKNIAKTDIKNCVADLQTLYDELENLPTISFSELSPENSALVIVDVINGFLKNGAMASPDMMDIVPPIAKLMESCNKNSVPIFAFADSHPSNSTEFEAYPPHCLENSEESKLVDELASIGGHTLFLKNSTNGFVTDSFRQILAQKPEINTFIVTGDCSDICVLQFCLTLKAYFDEHNKKIRIIIPIDTIDTFNAPTHNRSFYNLTSYAFLRNAGINFVKSIEN